MNGTSGQLHVPPVLQPPEDRRYDVDKVLVGSKVDLDGLPLPGIEPWFLGRQARNLITVPTEL